jgi:C4-dicarboxylate transporter, DctM subunit
MEPITIGFIGVAALIVFLVMGVPVSFTMGFVGTAGLICIYGVGGAVKFLPLQLYSYVSNFTFAALPLFLLLGYIAVHADLAKDSYDAARTWLGKLPGGLATATVYACAIFGAISGSGLAEAAVFSKIAVPEMIKSGYSKRMSVGVVAAASGIDSLIPPSIVLVVYGVLTQTSIGKLLIAGVIPGLIYTLIFSVAIVVWYYRKPLASLEAVDTSWKARLLSLRNLWAVVAIVLAVLGSIYFGWATPDEAAGVGVVLVFGLLIYRRKLNGRDLKNAAIDSAMATSMIMLICAAASIFTIFLSVSGVIGNMTSYLLGLNMPFWQMLVILQFFYLVLGCFMDVTSMQVLTLPIVVPIIRAYGGDLVWYGIVLTMTTCVGGITPPFGLNVFVMKATLGDLVTLGDIFAGAAPFIILMVLCIAIFAAFPQVVLWLPGQMFGR